MKNTFDEEKKYFVRGRDLNSGPKDPKEAALPMSHGDYSRKCDIFGLFQELNATLHDT